MKFDDTVAKAPYGDTNQNVTGGSHWLGSNPIWLDSPEQVDRLRAMQGDDPATPPHEAIYHGPDGVYGVLPDQPLDWHGPRRGHYIRRLTEGQAYNGIEGPFESAEEARAAASRLAGKEPVAETAAQYARAVNALQRSRR